MSESPARDLFPSTHATWLQTRIECIVQGDQTLAQQAAQELREHLMVRYAEPLCAYIRGSSLRSLTEPQDLVHDFFARVLGDAQFLVRWRQRGGPLRRWMINGLLLHARGVVRDRARNRERSGSTSTEATLAVPSNEPSAQRAFESAWALAILDAACKQVQDAFDRAGRAGDFELFHRHVIDGKSYSAIEAEIGVDPVRAATIVRAVTRALRESLIERLREEGATADTLDAEVRSILRLIGQE